MEIRGDAEEIARACSPKPKNNIHNAQVTNKLQGLLWEWTIRSSITTQVRYWAMYIVISMEIEFSAPIRSSGIRNFRMTTYRKAHSKRSRASCMQAASPTPPLSRVHSCAPDGNWQRLPTYFYIPALVAIHIFPQESERLRSCSTALLPTGIFVPSHRF